MTLEVVPGAVAGPEFDVAIELPPPRALRERVVYAPCDGRFGTHRSIGEQVRSGDVLGTLGAEAIVAPIDGCLRGLSARGARLRSGDELVEIDPSADSTRCFGLDPRASAIAEGVSRALQDEVRPRIPRALAFGITAIP